MYSLDEMILKFSEHSLQYSESREKNLKDWIENNPHQPIPEWLLERFNVSEALKCICSEIKELKEGIKNEFDNSIQKDRE